MAFKPLKMATLLIWTILALGAAAAPPVLSAANVAIQDTPVLRVPTPVKVSETCPCAAACTNGVPASKQHHSAYPINDYTLVEPEVNMASYMVRKDWYDDHWVSGPHYMAFTHNSDPYAAFKCQFICNANENCTAYFVWYEDANTEMEHVSCVLFDAVINPSVFMPAHGTIGAGGYDKLCSP